MDVAPNRYFQYKTVLSSDDPGYVPQIRSVTVASSAGTYQDSDNSSSGFSAGTHQATEFFSNTEQWLTLLVNRTSGNFTSRIFNAGNSTDWKTLSWLSQFPAGKELPNNQAMETGYLSGNADMAGNTLLLHLNEASGSTVFNDDS
jgi:hypothetical protein